MIKWLAAWDWTKRKKCVECGAQPVMLRVRNKGPWTHACAEHVIKVCRDMQ